MNPHPGLTGPASQPSLRQCPNMLYYMTDAVPGNPDALLVRSEDSCCTLGDIGDLYAWRDDLDGSLVLRIADSHGHERIIYDDPGPGCAAPFVDEEIDFAIKTWQIELAGRRRRPDPKAAGGARQRGGFRQSA